MGDTPDPPPTPDPQVLADQQGKLNQQAQAGSLVDQKNPFGSINYSSSIDPATGAVRWTSNTSYTPQQQAMLDSLQQYQTTSGNTANSLLGQANSANNPLPTYAGNPNSNTNTNGAAPTYSNTAGDVPTFNETNPAAASSLTQKLLDQETSYLNPQFKNQTDQLDTKLRTQGITPDSPAYKQQLRDVQLNQNQAVTGFLAQAEPAAFGQVSQTFQNQLQGQGQQFSQGNQGYQNQLAGYNANLQNFQAGLAGNASAQNQYATQANAYQLPYNLASTLMGSGSPAALNFTNPAGAQVQPANISQAYQSASDAYKNQLAAAQQDTAAWSQPLGAVLGATGTFLGGNGGAALIKKVL